MEDKKIADNDHSAEHLEQQLRALMEALPYASWFKDGEGRYEQVNRIFLESVDRELEKVLGRTARKVLDVEDTIQSEEGDREVLLTGKTSQANYSRDKRIFRTVNFPVQGPDGKIRGIGGYQEDITNLTNSLQSLHREKEYLEALLEHIPFHVFLTDRDHKYLRVNRMMAGLLRIEDPLEAQGKGTDEYFSKRLARKMQEEDRNILETGNPILNRIIYFEDEGVDGFWMEINKIPIRDERGVITMIVGIFKDISELMKIENELKQARDKAQESDRLKTSFLANMSHEIRTPMNGIVGFANLLRDPDLSEDKRDLYLKHIDHSSRQLLNIIDDIIDISKIESGQLKISNKPVRINTILDEIYSSYFHRIRGDAPGQKKVDFKLEKGEEANDFTIVTDDYRLRQIFINLIDNSIKFTKEGSILFGYKLDGNRYIEFFVSDTGIGIEPDKTAVIFDRFGQVNEDSSDQPTGTGLGLPISKSLVNLMGGEMWVESEPGEGSTFHFTLPLVTEDAVEEPHVIISNKSYNWTGSLIVVAEDEELNWMFIREMLRKTGAEILRARDGREVVSITRNQKPDVVLMDIKMPELSGIEATRRIRAFNSEVPIIAQTAYVMAEEKEECSKAGCNHFVTKPLDRTVLMEIIDSYIKKRV